MFCIQLNNRLHLKPYSDCLGKVSTASLWIYIYFTVKYIYMKYISALCGYPFSCEGSPFLASQGFNYFLIELKPVRRISAYANHHKVLLARRKPTLNICWFRIAQPMTMVIKQEELFTRDLSSGWWHFLQGNFFVLDDAGINVGPGD